MASDDQRTVTERIYADGVAMVQLLGPQDRLLRMLEREHRDVQVLVRGSGTFEAMVFSRTITMEQRAVAQVEP